MKPALYFVRCLLLCASFVTAAFAAGPTEGQPAPAATFKTFDGQQVDITSLRGDVVILTFWATWCQYCRQELGDLSAYYREHQAEGLRVFAISADDAEEFDKVRQRARDYPFPIAVLADADVSRYGRIWRLPLTFVIDRNGVLRRDGWGNMPAVTRAQLEETVTPLLRAKH